MLPGASATFGDSSPEKKQLTTFTDAAYRCLRTIDDADIIEQQNTWGSIWLTRNKELIEGRDTNPLFVYQTPLVSFANPVTPLLVNSRPWYIDTINAADGQTPQQLNLDIHIKNLFDALLPASATRAYDLRLACRYAFALASDSDADLMSALPVLLGPQLRIPAHAAIADSTRDFQIRLSKAMRGWLQQHRPRETNGLFVFSVAIFSNLSAADGSTMSLLQIDDLRLRLAQIADLHDTSI